MRDTGIAPYVLTPGAIQSGRWTGTLTAAAPELAKPVIDLCLGGARVADVALDETGPGTWSVRVDVPVGVLSDGVQTFTLVDRDSGLDLAGFSVSLGEALDQDLRAEIDLLRAELDLLKRAFRRHCTED